MIPSFRHSRREVTKRKFDLGSKILKQNVVVSTKVRSFTHLNSHLQDTIAMNRAFAPNEANALFITKVSPLASFAVSVPQQSPKVPPTTSSLRKLAESLGSSPLAAIIEQNDDQVTPVQDYDIRTETDRFLSSTPKPGKEATNRRRPIFYVEKPSTPVNDPDLSRISRNGGGLATITTPNSKRAQYVNVSIDEGENNQTLTFEAPPVVSSSRKRDGNGQPKSKASSAKTKEKMDINNTAVKSSKSTVRSEKNISKVNIKKAGKGNITDRSVVNSSNSPIRNNHTSSDKYLSKYSAVRKNQNNSDKNVSKTKERINQNVSDKDKNVSKTKDKTNQNTSDKNKNVSKTSDRNKQIQTNKNISTSSFRENHNRSVLNISKASNQNIQNRSKVNVSKRKRLNESQKNDTIIVQSQEANQGRSGAKRRKTSLDVPKQPKRSSVSNPKQTQPGSQGAKSRPKPQLVQRRHSSEREEDENEEQQDVMMLLWEKEGVKRKKGDFCDVDVVLNTVTEVLEEERDLLDNGRARKAVRFLEKNLVQDITKMIDSDKITRDLQRDIKKSTALLQDKQDTLMDLQLKRMELEEAGEGLKEKEQSQKNQEVINTFLKDLKQLIVKC